MDTSSVDWTAIINNAVNQVPVWLAIANQQPIPVVGPGTQGGAVMLSPSGVSASFSPGLIIAAVVGVIAIVYLVKR